MRIATSIFILMTSTPGWAQQALVLQSDFGIKDGAVASMKGVAVSAAKG